MLNWIVGVVVIIFLIIIIYDILNIPISGENSRHFTVVFTKNNNHYTRRIRRKLFETYNDMMEREGFGEDYKGRLQIYDRWVYLEIDEG